jgi:hypothetical protein
MEPLTKLSVIVVAENAVRQDERLTAEQLLQGDRIRKVLTEETLCRKVIGDIKPDDGPTLNALLEEAGMTTYPPDLEKLRAAKERYLNEAGKHVNIVNGIEMIFDGIQKSSTTEVEFTTLDSTGKRYKMIQRTVVPHAGPPGGMMSHVLSQDFRTADGDPVERRGEGFVIRLGDNEIMTWPELPKAK